jgi:transcriptional regulator of acetoin/glycerol metabolism
MAQLRRLNWPGNVTQLRRLLSEVVKRRHSGVIEIGDLPPEARTAGHRVLTPIEALERDAIVQALLDNAQRPAAAARALGMSRATIYRKFHHYGISLPLAH